VADEYGWLEILNGLHIEADNKSDTVSVEFENKNKKNESKYFKIQVQMMDGKRIWALESVMCTENKGLVSVQVAKKTVYVRLIYFSILVYSIVCRFIPQ
jgi:hypothetical protein